jgi:hypothetical protein
MITANAQILLSAIIETIHSIFEPSATTNRVLLILLYSGQWRLKNALFCSKQLNYNTTLFILPVKPIERRATGTFFGIGTLISALAIVSPSIIAASDSKEHQPVVNGVLQQSGRAVRKYIRRQQLIPTGFYQKALVRGLSQNLL